jgi:sulfur-oxidizing protein SoxB
MQTMVNEARAKGAHVVVVLSHNGVDVDIKMASRVTGIDAILGGQTHDGMPVATLVNNKSGKTIVTNAGSNGKFLGVLDFQVKEKRVTDFRYKLLPVFSNMLPADKEMDALITKFRAPYESKLNEKLGISEGLLYRRGNFNGTGDQLLIDALMDVQGAEIAFSPGFRWGTTLLPGQAITREWLLDMTATTYSFATVTEMTGETIKTVLEDVCDNLFNPDPYYQQGGDMVRVGGLQYQCNPTATMGKRIEEMRLNGKLIEAGKKYKVAGWAPVAEEARSQGNKQVWEVVEQWLKTQPNGRIKPRQLNAPKITGGLPNPGYVV